MEKRYRRNKKFTEYCNICKTEITAKTVNSLKYKITIHSRTRNHKLVIGGLKNRLRVLWNKKLI